MSKVLVTAKGCNFFDGRAELWQAIRRDITLGSGRMRIVLEEEPDNPYDRNAIAVKCEGAANGTLGYVAREQTGTVRDFARYRNVPVKRLDVRMADFSESDRNDIRLLVSAA